MDAVFPTGFPAPTAFYLTLYVLTLVVHVVFMNYVLAGTGYLAVISLFTGGAEVQRQKRPVAAVLRDWMPFALSAAITAGVAPLLFLQILYKPQFYTANLLLSHRWMAILPLLIAGFYLLYLLKSRVIGGWSLAARAAVGCGAFLCIAFTGYSWTENHLLSLAAERWPSFYEKGEMIYWHPALLPRLGMWLLGAVPTMVTLVSWQLWTGGDRVQPCSPAEVRRFALLALAGLALAGASGMVYYAVSEPQIREAFTGRLAGVYLLAAAAGALLQTVAWINTARRQRFAPRWLWTASAGTLLTITGMAVVREALRVSTIDLAALYPQHAAASARGGLVVFLVFLTLNTVVIAGCVWTVKRHLRRE